MFNVIQIDKDTHGEILRKASTNKRMLKKQYLAY